jgi:hypothetical protein
MNISQDATRVCIQANNAFLSEASNSMIVTGPNMYVPDRSCEVSADWGRDTCKYGLWFCKSVHNVTALSPDIDFIIPNKFYQSN